MSASSHVKRRFATNIDPTSPDWSSGSTRWPFLSCDFPSVARVIQHADQVIGHRARLASQTRFTRYKVGGTIVNNPSQNWFNVWLPYILGATEAATDTFHVAETLTEFAMLYDEVGTITEYESCKVKQFTLRSSGDGLLEASTEVSWLLAESGASWNASIGNPGTAAADHPLAVVDATVSLESGNRNMLDWSLNINNNVTEQFFDAEWPVCLLEGMREITFEGAVAFTSTEYAALAEQDENGAAATIKIAPLGLVSNDDVSLTITMRSLHIEDQARQVRGDQVILPLRGVVTSDGTQVSTIYSDIFAVNDITAA